MKIARILCIYAGESRKIVYKYAEMTTLIIARHGNTFEAGETPRRVGGRTDLPLTKKGHAQGTAIGRYLKTHALLPDAVYSAALLRTRQTAQAALAACGVQMPVHILDMFNEIDYGPDENQPEDAVIARIGREAMENWDRTAVPPDGWHVNPQDIIRNWHDFADAAIKTQGTVLVVTSNGIARFAPHITGNFKKFAAQYPIKLSTGALGIMEFSEGKWHVSGWNIRPA